jgi:hypothetical protein
MLKVRIAMESHPDPQLVVLIGIPHHDQTSMHYDVAAMYEAWRQRGVAAEQILCLEGKLDRRLLLSFLSAIHQRMAAWPQGSLFFYVTGHGFFTGESAEEARVGVELEPSTQLSSEYHLFWDEMLAALAVPASVKLLILADH